MSQIEARFIEKKQNDDPASDFEKLVSQVIGVVQRLTGHTWTDYNLHDPGVTIIEQLCFAITDLAYRTDFPVEDLITDPNGLIHRGQHAFFTKEQILSSTPITASDFRKFFLDEIEEIDNVMLLPVKSAHSHNSIKSLYAIQARLNCHIARDCNFNSVLIDETCNKIKDKITHLFLENRSIGQGLSEVIVMQPQDIDLSAEITIKYSIAPEEILVKIHNAIEELLNPKTRVFTEKELLDNGMTIDEIYRGPFLKCGFIPDSELKPIETEIDPIAITNAIMNVEGVVFVRNIVINGQDTGSIGKPFVLDKNHFPLLDTDSFFTNVHLYTEDCKLNLKETIYHDLINRTWQLHTQHRKVFVNKNGEDTIKKGVYRHTGEYFSIQNNFPVTYGIGHEGISAKEPDERKAAVRQLKAYLLFFEQILANYLAQLNNLSNLYSMNTSEGNIHSYFTQPLYNVPGISILLSAFTTALETNDVKSWDEFIAKPGNAYVKSLGKLIETPEEYIERKNKIFDHLLARFNRQLSSYPILHYFNSYIQGNNEEQMAFLLNWKASIINQTIDIDQSKIKAFNYKAEHDKVSGFEEKVSLLLNITQKERRRFSSIFQDGSIAVVSETSANRLSPINQETSVKVKWGIEELDIVSMADEIIGLSEIGNLLAGGINQDHAYILRNQKIDFLKHGIQKDNYRIGESPYKKNEFLIAFKNPSENTWKTISHHSDKMQAVKALDTLINYLRQLNIKSEGFHLLEHILLRPGLHQPAFGFRFCSGPNEAICQNHLWTTFHEREIIISRIKDAALQAASIEEQELDNAHHKLFQIKTSGEKKEWETVSINDLIDYKNHDLCDDLRMIGVELEHMYNDKTRVFPRFELLVRLPDGTVISEGFYNLTLTMALPSWPARFQDKEFRIFVEDLFRSIAPAFERIRFRWFGLKKMKQFEDLYFKLLNLYKKDTAQEEIFEVAGQMISFLLK